MFRAILILALLAALGVGGGLYVAAGRAAGPTIEILSPTDLVGRNGRFEAAVESPDGVIVAFEASIRQGETALPLMSLTRPAEGSVTQDGPNRIRFSRSFDRQSHPELAAGPATVQVTSTRPVFFGLRQATSVAQAEIEVRLDPPRLAIASTFHYVTHGGAELAVYRVTPPDVESGVRVGDRLYPGYPASGGGVTGDPALHMAFFSLSYDQDLQTPIELFARDRAGNEATAAFDHRVFPADFRRSRIGVGDTFLRRVVPSIVAQAPELADEDLAADTPAAELLDLYLFINGRLREANRATVSALAAQTTRTLQWEGPFRQLANSQVESGFADYRTYLYDGEEVDQQVHLGFDLASTANAPVRAANRGTVVFAEYLGIYGNCVIVDHGMGLQTLYAHLSSIGVSPGTTVEQDDELGRSGQTGLAGGDHLHFATFLHGRAVNPVEWWDPHWLEDRILRKLRDAGGPAGDAE